MLAPRSQLEYSWVLMRHTPSYITAAVDLLRGECAGCGYDYYCQGNVKKHLQLNHDKSLPFSVPNTTHLLITLQHGLAQNNYFR